VTATPPATTDAVKLTTLPDVTLVTVLPPDRTVNWVVLTVGVCARSLCGAHAITIAMASARTVKWSEELRAPEELAVEPEKQNLDMIRSHPFGVSVALRSVLTRG
jgi:cobalamin biosynthesis protein CobT